LVGRASKRGPDIREASVLGKAFVHLRHSLFALPLPLVLTGTSVLERFVQITLISLRQLSITCGSGVDHLVDAFPLTFEIRQRPVNTVLAAEYTIL
jgi:hypothetical protein